MRVCQPGGITCGDLSESFAVAVFLLTLHEFLFLYLPNVELTARAFPIVVKNISNVRRLECVPFVHDRADGRACVPDSMDIQYSLKRIRRRLFVGQRLRKP